MIKKNKQIKTKVAVYGTKTDECGSITQSLLKMGGKKIWK